MSIVFVPLRDEARPGASRRLQLGRLGLNYRVLSRPCVEARARPQAQAISISGGQKMKVMENERKVVCH